MKYVTFLKNFVKTTNMHTISCKKIREIKGCIESCNFCFAKFRENKKLHSSFSSFESLIIGFFHTLRLLSFILKSFVKWRFLQLGTQKWLLSLKSSVKSYLGILKLFLKGQNTENWYSRKNSKLVTLYCDYYQFWAWFYHILLICMNLNQN